MEGDVTILLNRWSAGDGEALEPLVGRLYPDLKKIAQSRMRCERSDHTLQATALVSEFFIALARNKHFNWNNRSHFLAVASRIMRRMLVDYARGYNSEKRGGALLRLTIDGLEFRSPCFGLDMIELDLLLDRLRAIDERAAHVVDMRCFGGLTNKEISDILEVDERTVRRDWQFARAWLGARLEARAH